uniref:Ion_trans domain-containing protein n=1 Tax=Heterorhabditis bacteriophora TaxID=37862 RepID=A0A1I7WZZ9_HETBA
MIPFKRWRLTAGYPQENPTIDCDTNYCYCHILMSLGYILSDAVITNIMFDSIYATTWTVL